MARFVRSQIIAWKIMYRIDLGGNKLSPTFFSKRDVLDWFDEHIDAGDGVVCWEFICGRSCVDRWDNWYLEYYDLTDHDVFPGWAW